ncbi:hypothetical protein NVS55_08810 [Myxococcus stipitatus]|uniref:DUF7481 family protein n=1 Tax=Myxococcus stipitatus TaxID=83455 RepID=UPI0031450E0F
MMLFEGKSMRRFYTGLLLAALGGVGCGDTNPRESDKNGSHGETFHDLYKSGSRLKVTAATTREGLRWPFGLSDTSLLNSCSWEQTAADGTYSCVAGLEDTFSDSDVLYYFDAGCTEGLYSAFWPLFPGDIVAKEPASCGEGLRRFHFVGEAVTGAVYLRNMDGTCRLAPGGSVARLYRVGAEVPAETFVRGRVKPARTSGGVTVQVIEGEDGSVSPYRLEENQHKSSCIPQLAQDEKFRCMPFGLDVAVSYSSALFANATCNEPAYSQMDCEAPARFAVAVETRGCERKVRVHAVAERIPVVFTSNEGQCSSSGLVGNGDDMRFYRAGSELPAETWPEATKVDLSTHGRLKLRGMKLGDSVVVPTEVFDTTLGTRCQFMVVNSNAQVRCVPSSSFDDSLESYSDAQCTQLLASSFTANCDEGAEAYAVSYGDTEEAFFRVYSLGARYEGDVIYERQTLGSQTRCVQSVKDPESTYRAVTGELPFESMALGAMELE